MESQDGVIEYIDTRRGYSECTTCPHAYQLITRETVKRKQANSDAFGTLYQFYGQKDTAHTTEVSYAEVRHDIQVSVFSHNANAMSCLRVCLDRLVETANLYPGYEGHRYAMYRGFHR